MAKNRIKQITEKDTALIARIPNYNPEKKYFTLVKKNGKLGKNNDGNAIIYETALPEQDLAVIEAYSYLQYWAEEETSCKRYSALDLMMGDFTQPIITENIDCDVEFESYQKMFGDDINAKPLRKLRKSMLAFHECLADIDKRMDKLGEYMEELDDIRENGGYNHMRNTPADDEDLEEDYDEEYDEEEYDEDDYEYDEEEL